MKKNKFLIMGSTSLLVITPTWGLVSNTNQTNQDQTDDQILNQQLNSEQNHIRVGEKIPFEVTPVTGYSSESQNLSENFCKDGVCTNWRSPWWEVQIDSEGNAVPSTRDLIVNSYTPSENPPKVNETVRVEQLETVDGITKWRVVFNESSLGYYDFSQVFKKNSANSDPSDKYVENDSESYQNGTYRRWDRYLMNAPEITDYSIFISDDLSIVEDSVEFNSFSINELSENRLAQKDERTFEQAELRPQSQSVKIKNISNSIANVSQELKTQYVEITDDNSEKVISGREDTEVIGLNSFIYAKTSSASNKEEYKQNLKNIQSAYNDLTILYKKDDANSTDWNNANFTSEYQSTSITNSRKRSEEERLRSFGEILKTGPGTYLGSSDRSTIGSFISFKAGNLERITNPYNNQKIEVYFKTKRNNDSVFHDKSVESYRDKNSVVGASVTGMMYHSDIIKSIANTKTGISDWKQLNTGSKEAVLEEYARVYPELKLTRTSMNVYRTTEQIDFEVDFKNVWHTNKYVEYSPTNQLLSFNNTFPKAKIESTKSDSSDNRDLLSLTNFEFDDNSLTSNSQDRKDLSAKKYLLTLNNSDAQPYYENRDYKVSINDSTNKTGEIVDVANKKILKWTIKENPEIHQISKKMVFQVDWNIIPTQERIQEVLNDELDKLRTALNNYKQAQGLSDEEIDAYKKTVEAFALAAKEAAKGSNPTITYMTIDQFIENKIKPFYPNNNNLKTDIAKSTDFLKDATDLKKAYTTDLNNLNSAIDQLNAAKSTILNQESEIEAFKDKFEAINNVTKPNVQANSNDFYTNKKTEKEIQIEAILPKTGDEKQKSDDFETSNASKIDADSLQADQLGFMLEDDNQTNLQNRPANKAYKVLDGIQDLPDFDVQKQSALEEVLNSAKEKLNSRLDSSQLPANVIQSLKDEVASKIGSDAINTIIVLYKTIDDFDKYKKEQEANLQSYKSAESELIYSGSNDNLKTSFDQAKGHFEQKEQASNAITNIASLKGYIDEYKNKFNDLKNAYNALDGVKENARKEIESANLDIEGLNDWKQKHKSLISQDTIDNNDSARVNQLLQDAYDELEGLAKEKVNSLTNLTKEEKDAFNQKIEEAQIALNENPEKNIDKNLDQLIQDAVFANEKNSVANEANELLSSLDQNDPNYINSTKKDQYDNLANELKELLKSKDSWTSDNLEKAKELINQIKAIEHDGIVELKRQAKYKINESNLPQSLEDSLVSKLDGMDQAQEVVDLKDSIENLDTSWKALKDSVEYHETGENATKDTQNYIESEESKKTNYDNSLTLAKELLNKESWSPEELNIANLQEQINQKTEDLDNARSELNGAELLNNAKKTSKNVQWDYLSEDQDAKADQEIDQQTTIKDLNAKLAEIKEADKATGELNQQLSNNQTDELSNLDDYTLADSDKKDALDQAIVDGSNLKQGDQASLNTEDIKAKAQAIKEAREELNGQEKLDAAKQEASDLINSLENIGQDQKQALKEPVDQVSGSDALEKVNEIKENAKTVDQALKELKDAIEKANTAKETVDYKLASTDPSNKKEDLDNALQEANEKVKNALNNGSMLPSLEEIDQAKDELKTARENLDGQEVLDKIRNDAKKAINSLENLNNNQKEVIKSQIDSLDDPDAIVDAIDKAKDLDSKMHDLKELLSNNPVNNNNKDEYRDYSDANENRKSDFDNAWNKAQDQRDEKPNLDANEVQEVIDNLKQATENLDGLERREDLTKQLKDLIAEADDVKNSKDFKRNTSDKQEEYNSAIENGENVDIQGDNSNINDLENAVAKIKEIKKDVYPTLDEIKEKIDNLPNLSETEKSDLKEKVAEKADDHDMISVLDKGENINDKKQTVIDTVADDENLSEKQKDFLTDQVKNEDLIEDVDNSNQNSDNGSSETTDQPKKQTTVEKVKEVSDALKEIEKALDRYNDLPTTDQKAKIQEVLDKLDEKNVPDLEKYKQAIDSIDINKQIEDLIQEFENTDRNSENFEKLKTKINDLIELGRQSLLDPENTTEANKALNDKINKKILDSIDKSNALQEIIEAIEEGNKDKFDKAIEKYKNLSDNPEELDKFIKEIEDKKLFDIIEKINDNKPISDKEVSDGKSTATNENVANVINTTIDSKIDQRKEIDVITIHWIIGGIATALAAISGYVLYLFRKK
ncbi:GA module-containing protein [Mycoplasma sp. Ms02]|uniref:GA module-containing protein n=1 Tax=Mycoplasma sp. Ms02 TaxID=353851 RepID=UPI001C89C1F9|nr:GA module-containing protein [Mycoplasma sp. Ms02]QZE12168.1 GA module-containing protein [Mycoplasma sp. Ms02]